MAKRGGKFKPLPAPGRPLSLPGRALPQASQSGSPLAAVYHSPRWKRTVYRLLKKHKRCVQCGATDRLEVDHIKPLRELGERPELHPLAWAESNLQVLCSRCHHKKDAALRKAGRDAMPWNEFVASLDWLGAAGNESGGGEGQKN